MFLVLVIPVWIPDWPRRSRSATLTPGHRLVVREVVVADEDVVHRPLRRRRHPVGRSLRQGAEQDIGDPLAGLDISRRHRRRGQSVDEGPRRERAARAGDSSPRWRGSSGRSPP